MEFINILLISILYPVVKDDRNQKNSYIKAWTNKLKWTEKVKNGNRWIFDKFN